MKKIIVSTMLMASVFSLSACKRAVAQDSEVAAASVNTAWKTKPQASWTFADWCFAYGAKGLSKPQAATVLTMIGAAIDSGGTSGCVEHNAWYQTQTFISLSNAGIQDVSPVASLTAITQLNITNNAIRDFSPLKRLKRVTYLAISGNPSQSCPLSVKSYCITD